MMRLEREIKFENVSFKYRNAANYTLKDANFVIKA